MLHAELPPSPVQSPQRHPAEHVTVTVQLYHVVVGGVPSEEDVTAAIDDLENLYRACVEPWREDVAAAAGGCKTFLCFRSGSMIATVCSGVDSWEFPSEHVFAREVRRHCRESKTCERPFSLAQECPIS